MKKIGELNLGFSDAQNYARRDNKKMFNDIFVKNYFLEKIINPNTYFLIGEKGTGKTAYSVYLKNNNYKENLQQIMINFTILRNRKIWN